MAIRDTMKLLNDDDSPEPSPTQSQLRNNQRSCPPGECSDQFFLRLARVNLISNNLQ